MESEKQNALSHDKVEESNSVNQFQEEISGLQTDLKDKIQRLEWADKAKKAAVESENRDQEEIKHLKLKNEEDQSKLDSLSSNFESLQQKYNAASKNLTLASTEYKRVDGDL